MWLLPFVWGLGTESAESRLAEQRSAGDQVLDGQAAKCSGGAGDDQGHGWLLFGWSSRSTGRGSFTLPFRWYALLSKVLS